MLLYEICYRFPSIKIPKYMYAIAANVSISILINDNVKNNLSNMNCY